MSLVSCGPPEKDWREGVSTNDIGIIFGQYLVILAQYALQGPVVLGFGFFHQALERLHALIARSKSGDEPLEALVRGLVIAGS